MTNAESPHLTTLRFIESWKLQDTKRLEYELISVHKETTRQPDVYHFLVDEDLIDPQTGRSIFDFIAKGVEWEVAQKLKSWAIENDEGLAVWISPRLEGVYPCNKIIIHTIAYTLDGKKVVLNSAILFDGELENPENLRKTLLTMEDTPENLSRIFEFLKQSTTLETSKTNNSLEHGLELSASYFAEKIKSGVDPFLIVAEMQRTGFLGKNSISCRLQGQTFLNLLDHRSLISIFVYPEFFECPRCKGKILSGRGITKCPHCGITKEEVGSKCD